MEQSKPLLGTLISHDKTLCYFWLLDEHLRIERNHSLSTWIRRTINNLFVPVISCFATHRSEEKRILLIVLLCSFDKKKEELLCIEVAVALHSDAFSILKFFKLPLV